MPPKPFNPIALPGRKGCQGKMKKLTLLSRVLRRLAVINNVYYEL